MVALGYFRGTCDEYTKEGTLMGNFSEQDPTDPDEPKLDYTPVRLSEGAAKLGPLVSQGAGSDSIGSSSATRSALLARKAIDESARRTRDLERRDALLSVAARTAAVAGVAAVAVAALLFVIAKPASRPSVASPNPTEITGSTSPSNQEEVGSKPALAELNASPSQPATHEQSQQLLQRLLEWREKANTTESSQ
jgi:hypothetical protein